MKIICLSDTHNKHEQIKWNVDLKQIDMIIHAGDVSSMGKPREIESFLKWFSDLPCRHKIFCAGNHDLLFENYPNEAKEILKKYPNVVYLENECIEIEGIKIFGFPYTPYFYNWAFNIQRGEPMKKLCDAIPVCDILISHGPPFGIFDYAWRNMTNVGCEDLLRIVEVNKPKYNIFGHIHQNNGIKEIAG